jgi:hypothetical protein
MSTRNRARKCRPLLRASWRRIAWKRRFGTADRGRGLSPNPGLARQGLGFPRIRRLDGSCLIPLDTFRLANPEASVLELEGASPDTTQIAPTASRRVSHMYRNSGVAHQPDLDR